MRCAGRKKDWTVLAFKRASAVGWPLNYFSKHERCQKGKAETVQGNFLFFCLGWVIHRRLTACTTLAPHAHRVYTESQMKHNTHTCVWRTFRRLKLAERALPDSAQTAASPRSHRCQLRLERRWGSCAAARQLVA